MISHGLQIAGVGFCQHRVGSPYSTTKDGMSKTRPLPRVPEEEAPKKPSTATTDRIGENVLRVLGQPTNLLRIQVRSLWGDFFRANIFTSKADTAEVSHSYFLQATPEGEILKSTPQLTRKYSSI